MPDNASVIAVFTDHEGAEAAVRKLAGAGIDMEHLSVVRKGYHTDEKVVGFYNTGDRMKYWSKRGAFWGGLWGWLFGGVYTFIPVTGHVVVLGYLAATVVSAIEGAVVFGGLSALGAALCSSGIPKDSVLACETAIKADGFPVTAHSPAEEMVRAREMLGTLGAARVDLHESGAAGSDSTAHVAWVLAQHGAGGTVADSRVSTGLPGLPGQGMPEIRRWTWTFAV